MDIRSKRSKKLHEKYAENLGVDGSDPPIEITRTIQIQSALGEDFDPQKIKRVLAIFNQLDHDLADFSEKFEDHDFMDLPQEAKDEWKTIVDKCWTAIGDILGEKDFKKIYDKSPENATSVIASTAFNG